MNKTLRKRKILLFVSLGLVAVTTIMTILLVTEMNSFNSKVNNALKDQDIYVVRNDGYVNVLSALIAPYFFFIFALIYIFSKKQKTVNRKWPYITMIVTCSIGVAYYLFIYNKVSSNRLGFISSESNVSNSVKDIIAKIWADSFKNNITFIFAVDVICVIAIIVLHSIQLALIKKSKKQTDEMYSEQVRNFQPKNNDLP